MALIARYRSILAEVAAGYRPRFRHELLTDWSSALLYRPVAIALTPPLARLSPSSITLAGLLCALALPWLAIENLGYALAWLAVVFCVLDCIDGNVARLTRRSSRQGAYLDFLTDLIFRACFYLGIGILAGGEPNTLPAGAGPLAGLLAALLAILARCSRLYLDAHLGLTPDYSPDAVLSSSGRIFAFLSGLDRFAPFLLLAALAFGGLWWLLVWLLLFSLGDFLSALAEARDRLG